MSIKDVLEAVVKLQVAIKIGHVHVQSQFVQAVYFYSIYNFTQYTVYILLQSLNYNSVFLEEHC